MPWHPLERAALAEALEASGPDGPTLCEGWRSRHLAAHVVLRERAPLAAAGIGVPALAARTERIVQRTGDEAGGDPAAWAALVDHVRQGPPAWSPLGWLGDAAQLVELFVHAEDVRRGAGRGSVPVRALPDGEVAALWRAVPLSARMGYGRSPVGVVLTDGTRHVRARRAPGPGLDVVVRGPVGELLLHAMGRESVAEVELEGGADAVAALVAAHRH